jgi:hypothetical protein
VEIEGSAYSALNMRVSFDQSASFKAVSARPDKNTFPYYSIGTFWKKVWKMLFYFRTFQTLPHNVRMSLTRFSAENS